MWNIQRARELLVMADAQLARAPEYAERREAFVIHEAKKLAGIVDEPMGEPGTSWPTSVADKDRPAFDEARPQAEARADDMKYAATLLFSLRIDAVMCVESTSEIKGERMGIMHAGNKRG